MNTHDYKAHIALFEHETTGSILFLIAIITF